ncbi:MAG: PQQ-binding-like beta-propeller repeat protein [Planctomycetes bacterium]|nr:PQQ-binding-like beta-propeller repeat protein [Planctomycetota bacterium]
MIHGSGGSRRRCGAAAVVALVAAALLPAQRPPARIQPRPIEFTTGEADNLFSLQRAEVDIHQWDLAQKELQAGEPAAAVERLHRLLQEETGGVVPIGPGRFFGLRLAVLTTLANLQPAAQAAYEALVQREAGNLARRPLTELEPDQLELLARRFPTASLGRRARLRLGDLAFTAGLGRVAADHYRLALDAMPIGSRDEALAVERLHCAGVLAQPRRARAAAAARRLPPAGDDVLAVLPPEGDGAGWPALGGLDGATPMAEPAGQPRPMLAEDVEAPGFDRREIGQFAMSAVGDLDGLYVATGRELIAFDPLRAGIAWVSRAPLADAPNDGSDPTEHVNSGTQLAAAVGDDVVVAALQVPDTSVNVDFQASFRIISKIPQRRLYAFSRRTGDLLWSHFDELEGPRTRRFRGHDACGPPLVVGDTVYAPVHDRSGAIAFSVAAYDLHTGDLRWRRLVCSSQQDVNMFGNALTEFTASPLAVADGVLYGASNLGVAYAIERANGRVRWIASYEVVRMPKTMLHGQADRPVYFANNPPAVTDGVVCLTPLDSMYVLGLEAETGAPLWRLSTDATVAGTENRVRWLAGALDDEFVLAGRGVVAIAARPGAERAPVRQLVRPEALRLRGDGGGSARPALTQDHVWIAAGDRILGFDRAGNPLANGHTIPLPNHAAGNLLFVDGLVVSLRQRALSVLFDPTALVGRVEARAAAADADPVALLRLARLRRALAGTDGTAPVDGEAMVRLFRRGLDACERDGLPAQHPVRQALQRELFDHLHEQALAAQRRGDDSALAQLEAARAVAPDPRAFVRVQGAVLDACRGRPALLRRELDRLLREAADETFPLAGTAGVPIGAYVAWQLAQMPDLAPADAVAAWQQLLERHGTTPLPAGTAAALAEAAIRTLVAAHGSEVYAAVEARAAAALAAARDDAAALRDLGSRFPNAAAAAAARLQLLDLSVREGDLAVACSVLAQGQRAGTVPPGVLRRVSIAALARGNRGLATAMFDRLRAHRDERSDWADDAGATYGEILARVEAEADAVPATVALPERQLARLAPRSPRQSLRVVTQLTAPGFAPPAALPLVCTTGTELLAFDPFAAGDRPRPSWSLAIEFLEHVVVCGDVLVVPDLQHVYGVDLRDGTVRWQLPDGTDTRFEGMQFDGLGTSHGLVHVAARSGIADGEALLLGIEPLSGTLVFERALPGEELKPMPKATGGRLVAMTTSRDGGIELHELDPLTGALVHTTRLSAATLQETLRLRGGELATWMFPQGIAADRDHVFLPIDGAGPTDAPRIAAVGRDGRIAWLWTGAAGNQLKLLPRGDRLVVLEGHERRPGRILLLQASDGRIVREARLGSDPSLLNWQRSWHDNPAPPILALSDLPDPSAPHRRFVAFAVDDDQPSFEVALANDDLEVEPQPLFGADFVTFGARSARNGTLRLYTLTLGDRSGALPGGTKYQRIELRSASYGVAAFGAYTVVSGTDGLVVLGPDPNGK